MTVAMETDLHPSVLNRFYIKSYAFLCTDRCQQLIQTPWSKNANDHSKETSDDNFHQTRRHVRLQMVVSMMKGKEVEEVWSLHKLLIMLSFLNWQIILCSLKVCCLEQKKRRKTNLLELKMTTLQHHNAEISHKSCSYKISDLEKAHMLHMLARTRALYLKNIGRGKKLPKR